MGLAARCPEFFWCAGTPPHVGLPISIFTCGATLGSLGGEHPAPEQVDDLGQVNPQDPRLLYRQKLRCLCLDTRYNARRVGSARVSPGFSRYSHVWSRKRHLNGLAMAAIVLLVNDQSKGQS
jgi:hypothetical protein